MALAKRKIDDERVDERPVYEPRPVQGDIDYDAVRRRVMASISKTREYLAR